jgi:hypothetical protein
MNDYLGNLVARTLGQMPVVQPRLASRFEPVESPAIFATDAPGLFQHRAAEPVEVEEEIEAVADYDPSSRPARSGRRTSHSDHTTEAEALPGAARPDGANLVSQAPPQVSVKTSTPQSQPEVLSQSRSPAWVEGNDTPLLPRHPSQTMIETNRADGAVKNFADPAPQPLWPETLIQAEARRADSSRRQEMENRRDRDEEKVTGQSPEDSSLAQTLQLADWLSPVSPTAVASPPFTPPIERKPVIKVTIGRVEVRAVISAPPAPAIAVAEQPQRVQALPLNEYLRRRNNGEL